MSKHHQQHHNHLQSQQQTQQQQQQQFIQSGAGYVTNAKKLPQHYDTYEPPDIQLQPQNGLTRPNGLANGHDANDTNNNHSNKTHHRKRSHGSEMRRSTSTAHPNSGDSSIKRSRVTAPPVVPESNSDNQHYDIDEELRKLHRQLRNESNFTEMLNLITSSFLLDKLVLRDRLHVLIIKLYPGNKGYSLAFRSPSHHTTSNAIITSTQLNTTKNSAFCGIDGQMEVLHETPSWPYENAHLLDALDAEELPAPLIEFCNHHCPHLYYNGNVIAQVRDYRQSYPLDICDIHHVLLRPSTTALWDEMSAVIDSHWSVKDRVSLESQLVLATAPPICLDPSPHIGIAAINATVQRAPLSQHIVKRAARRYLQVIKNRNGKLDKKTHHHQIELAMHLKNLNRRRDASAHLPAPQISIPLLEGVDCVAPIKVDKVPPLIALERRDWKPKRIERLTFETDRDKCQYHVVVDLFERDTNMQVTGELTVDRKKEGQSSGRTCPFVLSSPQAARRYVQEFTEIFTEEGRKDVKITHERDGEVKTTYTGRLQATMATKPSVTVIQAQQQQPPPPLQRQIQRQTTTTMITAPPLQQKVILTQESSSNQALKTLLSQPQASMTVPTINGHTEPVQAQLYLPVIISQVGQGGTAYALQTIVKRRDT